jgi:hypothetical protein
MNQIRNRSLGTYPPIWDIPLKLNAINGLQRFWDVGSCLDCSPAQDRTPMESTNVRRLQSSVHRCAAEHQELRSTIEKGRGAALATPRR